MKRKEYLTRRDKIVDFVIGFAGFFVLNAATYLLIYAIFILLDIVIDFGPGGTNETVQQGINIFVVGILPWVINVSFLAFGAWWRSWIAIGALSAFGFLLFVLSVLKILIGVCVTVGCLAIIGWAVLLKMTGV
jgi:hypothetical protein